MCITTSQLGSFTIHRLNLSEIGANCYIVQRGLDAVLIDPTTNSQKISSFLKSLNLNVMLMIATHGHFDHISAAQPLIELGFADTLYIHPDDIFELKKARTYMMMVLKQRMQTPHFTEIKSEQVSALEKIGLKVKHVGGHSKGSIVIYSDNLDFIVSGDMILHHSLNISAFNKTENKNEYINFYSWLSKEFKSSSIIFTGHGDSSTVRNELDRNPKYATIQ